MIAPDRGKVTIEDILYRNGYRDGEQDAMKRISQRLWKYEEVVKLAYPDLALRIRDAIEEIEALNEY